MGDQKELRFRHWRPVIFLVLGMLSIVMFVATYRTGQGLRILVICAFIVVTATTMLWNRDRRRRETESALRRSEEHFRIALEALKSKAILDERERYRSNLEAIFKSVRDVIIMVDRDLVVVELNDAAKEICGFSREAIGKPFISLQPGCAGCLDALRNTLEKREAVDTHNLECLMKNRSRRIVSLTTSPLIGPKGQFFGAVLVVKDDTRFDDLERDLKERRQFHDIIGKSEKTQELYSLIEDPANVQTTVPIAGESGTGKELAAGVSSAVVKLFTDYSRPGNIREMEHTLEHAFILCRQNAITVDHLPQDFRETLSPDGGDVSEEEPSSFLMDRQLNEHKAILRALKESAWNKVKAARLLGISKRTICRKIKEYNMMKG